jgi:hypothetical protein
MQQEFYARENGARRSPEALVTLPPAAVEELLRTLSHAELSALLEATRFQARLHAKMHHMSACMRHLLLMFTFGQWEGGDGPAPPNPQALWQLVRSLRARLQTLEQGAASESTDTVHVRGTMTGGRLRLAAATAPAMRTRRYAMPPSPASA